MAETTKRTTTRKKTTTPTKPVQTEEVVETVEVKEEKQVKRKKQVDLDILVSCRNVTDGLLVYVSKKTGLETIWSEYDAEEMLTVGELLTMKASQPKFLKEPWLIIDDEDVAEHLGLTKMYEDLVEIEDLDEFFESPVSEMEQVLTKLPKGLKETVSIRARKKIEDETLYDTRKIRLLEDKLKIDLSILR
ncbi:hypothetical protein BAOM_3111 [Peribacillus asahii]|uniref:Uncharacterized protein n=1 Tax=Peribacillus asahii TaxID=228899 RepID=A0A3Q9RKC1_9BACI|nr:hypothetical protein [Peribacillus asahii]AZV43720.1 hypothetical protein BAOM_3111 [Peribacillus asahii]